MSQDILINVTPQETRVAVVEDGVVQELQIERSNSLGMVGNIYRGVVCRVLPGMQSAFVDIGLQRAAFLHVADVEVCSSSESVIPIEQAIHEGQSLIVQVLKDPIGTKGARLTTQISLAGRFLVFLPQHNHIGVSQKIEDESEREVLKERLTRLLPKGHPSGYIIRTMSESASDEELLADIDYLDKVWANIQLSSGSTQDKKLLFRDLNLPMRMIRDVVTQSTDRIIIDSRETFQKLAEFAESYAVQASPKLEHYHGEHPLFDLHNIESEIEKAMNRKVELLSGGYLIFDQTEALTTVDVNTGGFVSGASLADTIFKTNLEASQAIARQLRLRNLGGIIIIDFIDMEEAEHRDAVLNELHRAVSKDRARISINSFSPLGLVEMTRKRTRDSLARVLCEPCPTCSGRGELKTPQTVCYEILRELLRYAKQFSAKELRLIASPKVVSLLMEEESHSLANLSDFIGKPISLQIETQYSQETYEIILM
jgi:ribonuclease G